MSNQFPRRALITGITGQDGSYLTELLLGKGYAVHGLVRPGSTSGKGWLEHLRQASSKNEPLQLFLHEGDLTDGDSLKRIVRDVAPDEIYNLAAQSHVQDSYATPLDTMDVTGTAVLRVLEAAAELNQQKAVRFFQAASSEMFGGVRLEPQCETTPFHPRSPYACAKVYAFHQTVNYRETFSLFACNGILFNHESPRRGESFVTRKITRAVGRIREGLQRELSLGNLDTRRDWGHAQDFVEAMWLMLQQETPDDYVVATGESHSITDFLDAAFGQLGLDWHDYVVSDPGLLRPSEVGLWQGDATKARKKLGWEPRTPFSELVRTMVEADCALARNERTAQPQSVSAS